MYPPLHQTSLHRPTRAEQPGRSSTTNALVFKSSPFCRAKKQPGSARRMIVPPLLEENQRRISGSNYVCSCPE